MDVNEAERLVRGLKVLGVQDVGRSWCVLSLLYVNPAITEANPPFRTILSAGGSVSIASLSD